MRSTTSTDFATARRSRHDQFPSIRRAKRSAALGCHQELPASIEGTKDMNTSDRGSKHVCPKCTGKYYDLGKVLVACPLCGAKPPAAKVPKAAAPARKMGRSTFGRYP